MTVLLAYGVSLLLFLLLMLWFLIPVLSGLPPVATKPSRVHRALKLARLRPGETLCDLGAGDGRVLFMAARDFGARAVGLEIGPIQCALIWLLAAAGGLRDKVQVRWANFYRADLPLADVVFLYATSRELIRLAPRLERQMKAGSRVVSISADFPEWEPSVMDERDLIFLYEMPPRPGNLTTYLIKKAR